MLDTTVEAYDKVMAVNCRAPLIASQEYARDIIARGGKGAIVNVSSIASFTGFADHAAYCASKGALDGLTRVMANELGRQGHPRQWRPSGHDADADGSEGVERSGEVGADAEADPDGAFRRARRSLFVIAYLLSDEAAMVNGVDLPIDGGFLIN